jgi:hypothetical protein
MATFLRLTISMRLILAGAPRSMTMCGLFFSWVWKANSLFWPPPVPSRSRGDAGKLGLAELAM